MPPLVRVRGKWGDMSHCSRWHSLHLDEGNTKAVSRVPVGIDLLVSGEVGTDLLIGLPWKFTEPGRNGLALKAW